MYIICKIPVGLCFGHFGHGFNLAPAQAFVKIPILLKSPDVCPAPLLMERAWTQRPAQHHPATVESQSGDPSNGFSTIYDLGMTNVATENGQVWWFSNHKWWMSMDMLVYQRLFGMMIPSKLSGFCRAVESANTGLVGRFSLGIQHPLPSAPVWEPVDGT